MDAELISLVGSAASSLVREMATDGYGLAKDAIVGLWRKSHPERAEMIGAELDEASESMKAATRQGGQAADAAADDLVAEWQPRLSRLLAANPGLVDELRALTAPGGPLAPAASTVDNSVNINVKASGNAKVNAAGRDMTFNA